MFYSFKWRTVAHMKLELTDDDLRGTSLLDSTPFVNARVLSWGYTKLKKNHKNILRHVEYWTSIVKR